MIKKQKGIKMWAILSCATGKPIYVFNNRKVAVLERNNYWKCDDVVKVKITILKL